MDARLRSRITRGLKKGDKVTLGYQRYYSLLDDEVTGQCYMPFLAIRAGRWWYLFRVRWKPGTNGSWSEGWKPPPVLTLLERKPAAMRITNRLAQLLVALIRQGHS